MDNHVEMDGEDYYDEDGVCEREHTLSYFSGLLRRDKGERLKFVMEFSKCVKAWVTKEEDPTAQEMLQAHLPTALRLSISAPYADVREHMSTLLHEVQERGYEIPKPVFTGPSSFIPKDETICYETTKEVQRAALAQVQSHYEDTFLDDGRLSNMTQLLGYHPSYLALFLKTHHFLMHGDGPLPLPIRNYVAILAASRHKCSYLVTMQETDFLTNHGDVQWLKGIQYLPTKLKNLLYVNKILAHQPWFFRTEQVKDLLVGRDSWSMSELVHAIAIMAHYHSLAGFCLGCGVNPEIDTPIGHTYSSKKGDSSFVHSSFTNPALGFGRRTPSDSESDTFSPAAQSPTFDGSPGQRNMTKSLVQHFIESTNAPDGMPSRTLMEVLTRMEKEGSSSDEENAEQNNIMFEKTASSAGLIRDKPAEPVPTPVNLIKYLEDPDYEHEDFNLSSAATLRAREYSWEDHAYPFLDSLYPDLGPLLDDKFKLALQMTYRRIGTQQNVDTGPFRQATWYYIHSIKGIRHDDYHYRRVNQLLNIEFKTYVRTIGCFPEKATRQDFLECIKGLEYSERIHVNMLVMEARLQAELIYALRAIMNYMKQS